MEYKYLILALNQNLLNFCSGNGNAMFEDGRINNCGVKSTSVASQFVIVYTELFAVASCMSSEIAVVTANCDVLESLTDSQFLEKYSTT